MLERLTETGRCHGIELNVETTEVMRISKQPSRVQIVIDQKQPENVECYKYLDSMITNDTRCACEIKPCIALATAAFKRNKILFTSQLDLKLRKKPLDCYTWNAILHGVEGK
jgi:hypothetical protein